jgi:hypothetical protein
MNPQAEITILVRQPGPMAAVFGAMEAAEVAARRIGGGVEMRNDEGGDLVLSILAEAPMARDCTFRCGGPIHLQVRL